ncbi:hypothetical protein K501DRAFT_330216 [Backusella circina FSU 941]|nr:hypothetical protein K501DRAFT_330216 [Backusella circina FSU 941]
MNNLPFEILNQIFVLLHSQHKVECMTVCRQWRHVIESSSLFHTIRVSDMTQMNKLIERVQREPTQGTKVERLILDLEPSDGFDMETIPILFPNVRVFIAFNIMEDAGYNTSTERSAPPHPWHNHIEHIAEYASGINIPQLLTSSMCLRLTKLSIYGNDEQHGRYIIDLLVNAPALKTLSILGFCFNLTDFESLHKNVPNLQSLSIDDTEINCDIKNADIKPATSVTTFELKSTGVFLAKDEIELLLYISKKYPNLLELSYGVVILDEVDYDLGMVYHDGLVPFMKGLGTRLNTLSLGLNNEIIFPFELLDNAGCQIKKLVLGLIMEQPILEQLARSSQVESIQVLIVNYIVNCNTLNWLKGFRNLKELNLCHPFQRELSKKKMIDISELLTMLGDTLEVFTLRGVQLSFNALATRQYPLIKSITLVRVTLPSGLDDYFSRSFPNLRSLSFRSCDWSNGPFILPNTNLSYLEIADKMPKDNDVILIKTLNNDEARWYTAKAKYDTRNTKNQFSSNDAPVYPAIKSLPFEEYIGEPFMALTSIFLV